MINIRLLPEIKERAVQINNKQRGIFRISLYFLAAAFISLSVLYFISNSLSVDLKRYLLYSTPLNLNLKMIKSFLIESNDLDKYYLVVSFFFIPFIFSLLALVLTLKSISYKKVITRSSRVIFAIDKLKKQISEYEIHKKKRTLKEIIKYNYSHIISYHMNPIKDNSLCKIWFNSTKIKEPFGTFTSILNKLPQLIKLNIAENNSLQLLEFLDELELIWFIIHEMEKKEKIKIEEKSLLEKKFFKINEFYNHHIIKEIENKIDLDKKLKSNKKPSISLFLKNNLMAIIVISLIIIIGSWILKIEIKLAFLSWIGCLSSIVLVKSESKKE